MTELQKPTREFLDNAIHSDRPSPEDRARIKASIDRVVATSAASRPRARWWKIVGVSGVFLIGLSTFVALQGEKAAPREPQALEPQGPRLAGTQAAEPKEPNAPPPPPRAVDNAPPENAPALPRRPRPATRLPVPPKLGLEDEARIVGDAKIALRRADHERVLDLTNEHAKLFPNGSLVAERLAAEVMALCALDRRSEAKATRALLASRERPALLERVDAACEGPLLPER